MWTRSFAFRRPVAVATGLLVGSLALTVTPATGDTKAELEAARARLRAIQKRIAIGQDRLAAFRAKANATVAQMNQVESTIALIQQESNTVRREITKARRRLTLHQRRLDNRARVMFQTGSSVELALLLGSTSLSDFSSRLEILERATARDQDLIERVQALAARLQYRQRQLEELERQRLAERRDLRVQWARLQQQFAAQTTVIRQMGADRRAAEALIRQLEDKRTREIQQARQLARAATQAIVGSSRPAEQQGTGNSTRPPGDQAERSAPNQQAQPTDAPSDKGQQTEIGSPTEGGQSSQRDAPSEQDQQTEAGSPQEQGQPSQADAPSEQDQQTEPGSPQEQRQHRQQRTNDSSDSRGRQGETRGPADSSSHRRRQEETDSSTAPRPAGTVFAICPVDQPRAYTDDFGAPRSGGRTHQGNDIFAPYGTPIRAPFAGTASDSSNGLGGLAVTVHGAQGHVYNAHLSRVGTLGKVSAGTIIGYVGNSGNARGTPPHNHFEWHPGAGSAVNPYSYLNEVC